jgi:hypothetical protein
LGVARSHVSHIYFTALHGMDLHGMERSSISRMAKGDVGMGELCGPAKSVRLF